MASEVSGPPTMPCSDCNKTHSPRALPPLPFHSLVAQERMPDASDTAAIRDFLLDTRTEIAWRERAVDRLLCEVAELRRRLEQHESIVAPIRRVPPEIIVEIFLQLTAIEARTARHSYPYHLVEGASFFEKDYKVMPGPHRAPLLFGEVCRHWRAIALSTPRLWNSIFLHCVDEKLQNNIYLCDLWLKRSGSLPLSIRFSRDYHQSVPVPSKVIDLCQDFLRTILPYSRRWRLLAFNNIPIASYDILHGRLTDSLPVLEALSVDYGYGSPIDLHVDSSSTPWAELHNAHNWRLLHFRWTDSDDDGAVVENGEIFHGRN
ncbi:hypothetical protein K438DRAFT_1830479 [Mycena galopus ATCC 62051]|nr:hypothetical protein K438DRAFT_1830479 [Mycena galopus ATCC 62051]